MDPPDVPLETDRGGGVVGADEGRGRRALIKSLELPGGSQCLAEEPIMQLSMYQASAPVFSKGLRALLGILKKADAHAVARGIEPAALLQARLYPDMLPFTRQIHLCTDFAKGAVARLAGSEPPSFQDVETTFPELIARVEKTIAAVGGFTAPQVDGSEDRDITLIRRGETSVVKGQAYLLEQAMPNFYFHLTTAFAILRHNGVEIGKKDFLGIA